MLRGPGKKTKGCPEFSDLHLMRNRSSASAESCQGRSWPGLQSMLPPRTDGQQAFAEQGIWRKVPHLSLVQHRTQTGAYLQERRSGQTTKG